MTRVMQAVHPGEILLDEVIEANELTITKAAGLLKVSRLTLSKLVNKKSDITPEMESVFLRCSVVRLKFG